MAPARTLPDADPVLAEYDVFITPQHDEKLYVLQYPNRAKELPYNERNNARPLEMRIKPAAGFIEIDAPLNVHTNFDKQKGIRWGEAVRKAKQEGAAESGLAAGFGIGPTPGRGGRRLNADADREGSGSPDLPEEQLLRRFNDANDKGHVLNKQTMGGQIIPDEPGKPMYMIGVFRGKEFHLTKVEGIVPMRPQFHHMDAAVQVERSNARRDREAVDPPRPTEARAVQLTVKSADGENIDMSTTSEFLRTAQEEPWTRLRYHDEDDQEAYDAYHEKLFMDDIRDAPKLASSMTNDEYLDAISAPRDDTRGRSRRRAPRRRKPAVEDSEGSSGGEEQEQPDPSDAAAEDVPINEPPDPVEAGYD